MRTTLTIDDDLAVQLDRLRSEQGASLDEIVNEVLRRGLSELKAPAKRRRPFRAKPFEGMGPLAPSIDNIAETIALAEGEAFK